MVECIFVGQVVIDSMGAGLVVILVTGYNIPQGPQKYSLAVQVLILAKRPCISRPWPCLFSCFLLTFDAL